MNGDSHDELESFADKHGIGLDTAGHEAQEAASRKLKKAAVFDQRGIDARADTLRAEAADQLGADVDTLAGVGDDGTDVELSASELADHLAEYDLETLNSPRAIEAERSLLEKKCAAFEQRGIDARADTLARRRAALEAVEETVRETSRRFDSVDTLARQVSGEETSRSRSGRKRSRSTASTGGETVVLKETGRTGTDTLAQKDGVELDTLGPCGVMVASGERGRGR